ncbi:JmjC domain-containing protein [Gynuella sunshinyii]|uniref:JmjC domain-containing protein n=1 Tax=Gynuella sunshinyii YC6258 TaxID=1445510 RepID=A0A0C5VTW9_9GAMM|nr:cupin domain-containing protein [Gynuella sunshinyii]AJQ93779.1 hypothetical protein YC6258_01733 [Gynuella sunshinyii YC6258]
MINISPFKWNKFVKSAIESEFALIEDETLVDFETAITELQQAMLSGSGQLSYKLAGGCKGKPIQKGSFENILNDCRDKKVSYIIEGMQSVPGFYSNLAQKLSNTYLSNITINAFISCKDSQASPLHYDFHDLVNIQLLGSKKWNVYKRAKDISYHPTGYMIDESSSAQSVFSGEIKELDIFTIPRGYAHDVSTLSDISVHLAVGFRFLTHEDILLYKVRKKINGRLSQPIWRDNLDSEIAAAFVNNHSNLAIDVSKKDVFEFVLSSQKFWDTTMIDSASKAIFEKGSFFIEKKEETLKLSIPMVVHPSITIDPITFSPTEIELPIETEKLFSTIEEKGELDLSSDLDDIDAETVAAVAEILHSVGLADFV